MAEVNIGMSENEFIQVCESVKYRLKYGKVDVYIERRALQRFQRYELPNDIQN
jgi:topoisomerase IA-like protein